MNPTIPVQAPPRQCAAWCSGGHLPSDSGTITHVSTEHVLVTAVGGESHEFYVSVECVDGEPAPAAVRLEGPTSAPMTADQAMQLSWMLSAAAFAAVSGQAVAR